MIQKTYLKTKDVCKVKFVVEADDAQKVEVLGLNGDWNNSLDLKKRKDGSFCGEITLPKNTEHEFKYRVNGSEWINEPEADKQQHNEYGGQNSVITL